MALSFHSIPPEVRLHIYQYTLISNLNRIGLQSTVVCCSTALLNGNGIRLEDTPDSEAVLDDPGVVEGSPDVEFGQWRGDVYIDMLIYFIHS